MGHQQPLQPVGQPQESQQQQPQSQQSIRQQQPQKQPETSPRMQTINPAMMPSAAASRSASAPPAQARWSHLQDMPEAGSLVRCKTACPKELFIPQREIGEFGDAPESPKTSALSKQLKVFKVGKWVEYNSDSLGGYIPAKVVALNPRDSTVELDVKRGTWLSVSGPDAKVRKPKVRTDRSEWVFHL